MADGQTPENEHRFPCDACGSDLRFDPGDHQLTCDHCGNTSSIEGAEKPTLAPISELDYRSALNAELPAAEIEETRVSKCPNCAAEVEFDADLHATECPFCATPVVTDTVAHRHIKPRGVLPFALSEPQARGAMTDWLGGLWFAPNGLQDYARKGRSMQGIYVPYWTFDADTRTRYTGARGTVRSTGTGKNRRRTTSWRNVSGRVARLFDDVLVLASQSLPRRFTDALEPWDLRALEPYQPSYLAGFRAEGYQIDLRNAFDLARQKMDAVIRRDIKFDIGGDRQRINKVETEISEVTFKHVLLPVWMAAYRYRGKSYRFVVNGRTGRVRGERPWSAWKLAVAVILIALIAAAFGCHYRSLQLVRRLQ